MAAFDVIATTLASELSSFSDVEMHARTTFRLILAALLGGILGYERETSGKAAGVRTHMLVALGAALFVTLPVQAGVGEDGISRVTQGIIAGVGFLCAGTILKTREQTEVQGLTTAASIWFTAAIGLAAGMGYEFSAALAALTAWLILRVVPVVTGYDTNKNDAEGR